MTQLYLDASELQQPQNCRGGLPLETYENDKTWHRMTIFWRNWKPLLFWTSVCQIQKLQRCTLDPFLDPFPKSRDCVRDFKHIIAHNLSRCCSWTSSAMVSIRPMQRAELRPRCNMMQIKSATFFSLHSCQRWSWFKVYIYLIRIECTVFDLATDAMRVECNKDSTQPAHAEPDSWPGNKRCSPKSKWNILESVRGFQRWQDHWKWNLVNFKKWHQFKVVKLLVGSCLLNSNFISALDVSCFSFQDVVWLLWSWYCSLLVYWWKIFFCDLCYVTIYSLCI